MLFHQPILLFYVIWICVVSSHVEEDASDSRQLNRRQLNRRQLNRRQLTSDEISKIIASTREQDDDEHGKSTVESDERSLMSEIAENIKDLHRKYLPRD